MLTEYLNNHRGSNGNLKLNNMDNLSFGQRIDQENGLCELWLTHGALDEIKLMDLKDKNILMFGGGRGDIWLALRCKKLVVVERNPEWIPQTLEAAIDLQLIMGVRLQYLYRPCNDSSGMADYYLEIPEDIDFDVIINDDSYRTECCQVAVDYFKKRGGGILISDNWVQSYVWISPKAEEIMQPFEAHIHEQADHLDNDGVNKWKTAIHFIK